MTGCKFSLIYDNNRKCFDIIIGRWVLPSKEYVILQHGTFSEADVIKYQQLPFVNVFFIEQNNVYIIGKRRSYRSVLVAKIPSESFKGAVK